MTFSSTHLMWGNLKMHFYSDKFWVIVIVLSQFLFLSMIYLLDIIVKK